ncbi:hypothetical protein ATQ16_25695 [Salmonella enterica]|nr:hypothetical protein [Salmonella enterica]EBO7354745.1 hypothetical protein [Salmonella enterica]
MSHKSGASTRHPNLRTSYPVRRNVLFIGAASPPRWLISRARRKWRCIQDETRCDSRAGYHAAYTGV